MVVEGSQSSAREEDYNVARQTSEMADYPHGSQPAEGALERDELAKFVAEGFVVLRSYFAEDEIAALRQRMGSLLRRAVPEELPDVGVDRWLSEEGLALRKSLGVPAVVPDAYNPDRVTYMDNLQKHDPLLDAHLRHPKLLNMLSELLGDDIDAFQCATGVKPNDWDGEDVRR
eukprot:SAG31_NODE_1654_length_7621_cov_3.273597_1_plen_173_part_00